MSGFRGIEGLEGREPVGAVLALGRKGPTGAPIEKDRFHVVSPVAKTVDTRRGSTLAREAHPDFGWFNGAPPDKRRSVTAVLMHARAEDCFNYSLRAQQLPNMPGHPSKAPVCEGDGTRARRWTGDIQAPDDYQQIPCPNERCPFRAKKNPSCKPWMALLFRPLWGESVMDAARSQGRNVTPLMRYVSGSWNTTRNILGMFDAVQKQAAAFGLGPDEYSLLGLRFTLTIQEKTSAGDGGRRFPTVVATPAYDPAEFFMAQLDRRATMRAKLEQGRPEPARLGHDPTERDDYHATNPVVLPEGASPEPDTFDPEVLP